MKHRYLDFWMIIAVDGCIPVGSYTDVFINKADTV